MKITLNSDVAGIFTMQVSARVVNDEWIVGDIELYADYNCTQLVADGIEYDKLPGSSRMMIDAALNLWGHERRQDARLLAMAVERMGVQA